VVCPLSTVARIGGYTVSAKHTNFVGSFRDAAVTKMA
jgi:hypothetical protein